MKLAESLVTAHTVSTSAHGCAAGLPNTSHVITGKEKQNLGGVDCGSKITY